MDSPDYDDFIDMFSVPTPVSPLPPTPVTSPSHDVIYDSLPTMEQSMVPESPLKDPVDPPVVSKSPEVSKSSSVSTLLEPPAKKVKTSTKKVKTSTKKVEPSAKKVKTSAKKVEPSAKKAEPPAKKVEPPAKKVEPSAKKVEPPVKKVASVIHREHSPRPRWYEERRPRDPRLRPDFRPPYQRYHFKPRVFRRPPYAQQLMPSTQGQVFFHSQGLAVLCITDHGFTLTNGVVSYAMDRQCSNELFKFLHYLNVGTICVTDQHSKQKIREIQGSWSSSSPFKRTPVMLLNSNGRESGQCPFCNQTNCHRWIAVQGMCAILHQPINPIFHS